MSEIKWPQALACVLLGGEALVSRKHPTAVELRDFQPLTPEIKRGRRS
jgi:hypothetical protein